MKFSIKSVSPEKLGSACLVVGVYAARKLSAAAARLDEVSGGYLSSVLARGDLSGKAGSTLLLQQVPGCKGERVLLVGLGKAGEFQEKHYVAALRGAMKVLGEIGVADGALFLTTLPVKKCSLAWKVRQAAMLAQESCYRFEQFKSKKNETPCALEKLTLVVEQRDELAQAEEALQQGLAMAEGITLARNLGNQPGNVCTPGYLAETAQRLAQDHGLDCQVLDREAMEGLGMQALLSVARGSQQPPKFIVLRYAGQTKAKAKASKPLVLIGKGITFDSGGISLKPGEGMDEMKFDMCGAASVLGTLKAVALMQLPLDLVVMVPTTENMPGGAASKPGDIVTSMSGQTIEILNTDAEGRLILCDALTYAERFEPQAVIDIATLTGACVIALGHVASGLFANDKRLADALLKASEISLDRAWQLPLWEDYQEQLKSNFADMANIGGRPAGSVTAACFLARFAEKFAWAHLDIAGTAWKSGSDKGATGRPVSLLSHYLLECAGKLH